MFIPSFHKSLPEKKPNGQSTELNLSIWEITSVTLLTKFTHKSKKLRPPTFQSSIKRKKSTWTAWVFFLPLCEGLTELQLAISPSWLRQLSNFKESWVSGVHFISALRKGGSIPWTKNKANSIKIKIWKCFQWETEGLWANDFPSWQISNNSGNKNERH